MGSWKPTRAYFWKCKKFTVYSWWCWNWNGSHERSADWSRCKLNLCTPQTAATGLKQKSIGRLNQMPIFRHIVKKHEKLIGSLKCQNIMHVLWLDACTPHHSPTPLFATLLINGRPHSFRYLFSADWTWRFIRRRSFHVTPVNQFRAALEFVWSTLNSTWFAGWHASVTISQLLICLKIHNIDVIYLFLLIDKIDLYFIGFCVLNHSLNLPF